MITKIIIYIGIAYIAYIMLKESKIFSGLRGKSVRQKEFYKKRMKQCIEYEHFFKPTFSCKKCGCFLKLKCRLATQECPIGKWPKQH